MIAKLDAWQQCMADINADFDTIDDYEVWQERAAIMEFDGGLTRTDAERDAYKCLYPNIILLEGRGAV
ncbi:MAG: hypothetical protein Ta2B_08060 [Termitinemataceae bacterium]|nr:MAG: hypothetical protein Ta2B_08060 [Termitinemataceae bacterium]